jgi:hypothetical protein
MLPAKITRVACLMFCDLSVLMTMSCSCLHAARDNLATVAHGAWGTFWIALAVDYALMAGKVCWLGYAGQMTCWLQVSGASSFTYACLTAAASGEDAIE